MPKSLVILEEDGTATMSLGFRKYCALGMPLEVHRNQHGRDLFFSIPRQSPKMPAWVFNTTADAGDTKRQACSVAVRPPACLPPELRSHGCILVPSSPIEPLVKAALRTGLNLDISSLTKCSTANAVPTPVPTGAQNKHGKRSILKRDRVVALLGKIFPDLKPESEEYKRILDSMVGKVRKVTDEVADEVLEGVKLLDPDNAMKYSGLREVAEKVDIQRRVRQEMDKEAGRGL